MICGDCGSDRIAHVNAKCADLCRFSMGGHRLNPTGYVPAGVGLGDDSDYVDFKYCLDCGVMQSKFPVKNPA